MSERRSALKIIGTIGATCAFPFAADELYAQQEHSHTAGVSASLPEPKYFSKADFAIVAAIAECIIPATDTPGAIAAGVPAFIDFVVSRSTVQQRIFADGLASFKKKAKDFASLPVERQVAILQPLCTAVDRGQVKTANEKFFRSMKSLSADGYWTSKPGMADTLGFRGGALLAEYPECREH